MNNELIELITGAVLPPLIDLINRYVYQSWLKFVISLVVCLGVGALFNLDKLTLSDVLGSGAIVFTAAQTIYKTYWKNSQAREEIIGK